MIKQFLIDAGRGDYFATGPPGRWHGLGASELGCQGQVDPGALETVLAGNDPRTHERLAGLSRRRSRAGYELVIAAPKSISLLATLGGDGRAGILIRAHQAAVADILAYLQTNVRAVGAHNGGVTNAGWVAATFEHRRNAAGEPHLHSHALIVNAAATPDGWRCIRNGPELWAHQRAADARYFVALDAHLRSNGLVLEWERTPAGQLEVAGVPRAAIVAASTRRAQVLEAGPDRVQRERARRDTHNRRPDAPWPAAVAAAGFDGRRATEVLDRASAARAPATVAEVDLAAVEDQLLARGSLFRKEIAMELVATAAPAGATVDMLERWTAQVCARAQPWPGGQFLSTNAEQRDQRVAAAALERRGVGVGVAGTTEGLARRTMPLDPVGAEAVSLLVRAGNGVDVLGPGDAGPREAPILAQAAVLDAARVAWQAAGHRVAVLPGPGAQGQWQALTGLRPPPAGGPAPTVLVVDRADRLATPELGVILADAARYATKVVLVVGGSNPLRPQPRSGALARITEHGGSIAPGRGPAVEAVRHPGVALGHDRVATLSGSDALGHLFAAWSARQPSPSTMMVSVGRAEVAALNNAAHRHLGAAGLLRGPEHTLAGLQLREGERVLTLARGAGALGTVVSLGEASAAIRWDSGLETTLDRHGAQNLGYGYATTPALLRAGRAGPAELLGLGGREVLGPDARLAATYEVTATRVRTLTQVPDGLWRAAQHLDGRHSDPLRLEQPQWQLEREHAALARQLLSDPVPRGEGIGAWVHEHGPQLERWMMLGTAIDALGDLHGTERAVGKERSPDLVPRVALELGR